MTCLQIVCRHPSRARDFKVDAGTKVTSDVSALTSDASLDMFVEVAGGMDNAAAVIFSAAKAGKPVVTANKALLAARLADVEAAFPASGPARLGYEAAVAGGIPIIRTLQQALAYDNVQSVSGILNGTTNFMLSAMDARGATYAEILKEAQEAGFAEADPTADVEGHDARNKLILLARLAFGVTLPVPGVPTVGITGVTPTDVALARELGCTIKLVGRAAVNGGAVEVSMRPALVPRGSILGGTDGALNVVEIQSEFLGTSHYRGAGAGRYPTANSIVADMVNIALGQQAPAPFPRAPSSSLSPSTDVNSEALLRWAGPLSAAHAQWLASFGGTVVSSSPTATGVLAPRGSLSALAAAAAAAKLPAAHAIYPVYR